MVCASSGGLLWTPEHASTLPRRRAVTYAPLAAPGEAGAAWAAGDGVATLRRT